MPFLDAWEVMEAYLLAVRTGQATMADAPPHFVQNRRLMEEVIKVDPRQVQHAHASLRSNKEFMLIAARQWRGKTFLCRYTYLSILTRKAAVAPPSYHALRVDSPKSRSGVLEKLTYLS
jgi:hypothetical protein